MNTANRLSVQTSAPVNTVRRIGEPPGLSRYGVIEQYMHPERGLEPEVCDVYGELIGCINKLRDEVRNGNHHAKLDRSYQSVL